MIDKGVRVRHPGGAHCRNTGGKECVGRTARRRTDDCDRVGVTQALDYEVPALAPHYRVRGSVGGAPLTTSYSPSLSFTLDETRLRPLLEQPDQPLAAEEGGTLETTEERPATLATSDIARSFSSHAKHVTHFWIRLSPRFCGWKRGFCSAIY